MEKSDKPPSELDAFLSERAATLERSEKIFRVLGFLLVGIGVIAFFGLLSVYWSEASSWNDHVELWVGASTVAGASWALAGLFFLATSIQGQRLELQYNRQELRDTRREMQEQTREFSKQNETIGLQRFEDTFFKLLEAYSSMVESFKIHWTEKTSVFADLDLHSGRGVFDALEIELQRQMKSDGVLGKEGYEAIHVSASYNKLVRKHNDIFQPFMNQLELLVDFVASYSFETREERRIYMNAIAAQMTDAQRVLLWYSYFSTKRGSDPKNDELWRQLITQKVSSNRLPEPYHRDMLYS